ncbi:MAG: ABC transporter ATP-binding protein [Candidatus Kaelpia aquatica]|nr:ABC transporter ATP-binding protein [Candidatus Kaelpia aquatica]
MKSLEIKGLNIDFKKRNSFISVVQGLDLDILESEIVGIAGESGSGKTVSTLALADLLPEGNSRISYKSYKIKSNNVDRKQIPYFRGRLISYIFQDPIPSLDPMFTIRYQLKEILKVGSRKEVDDKMIDKLLLDVGLKDRERVLSSYPHQLSGGMAQRVAIAFALGSNSKILVADEPTTALDAHIKKGILDLLKKIRDQRGLSIFFISHDLEQTFYIADRVYIFYAGSVVEYAKSSVIKEKPLHPYTRALLDCIPKRGVDELKQIRGKSPDFGDLPKGCLFYPRCTFAMDICQKKRPPLIEVKKGHFLRCFKEKI